MHCSHTITVYPMATMAVDTDPLLASHPVSRRGLTVDPLFSAPTNGCTLLNRTIISPLSTPWCSYHQAVRQHATFTPCTMSATRGRQGSCWESGVDGINTYSQNETFVSTCFTSFAAEIPRLTQMSTISAMTGSKTPRGGRNSVHQCKAMLFLGGNRIKR